MVYKIKICTKTIGKKKFFNTKVKFIGIIIQNMKIMTKNR